MSRAIFPGDMIDSFFARFIKVDILPFAPSMLNDNMFKV